MRCETRRPRWNVLFAYLYCTEWFSPETNKDQCAGDVILYTPLQKFNVFYPLLVISCENRFISERNESEQTNLFVALGPVDVRHELFRKSTSRLSGTERKRTQ